MPSQEEYLDNLLQGISNREEQSDHPSTDGILDFDKQAENLETPADTSSKMTLEDIDKILNANQSLPEEAVQSESEAQDLMDLLSGDSDLEGIHDLLDKADKDEVIDSGIINHSNAVEVSEAEHLMDEIENASSNQDTMSDQEKRKQDREAKKAEKQARRLAAKQEKQAKKAEKRAAKEAARLQKASKKPTRAAVSQVVLPNPEESNQEAENQEEENQEWELLIKDDEEMSDVDSLFSEMEAMGIVDEENTIPEQELMDIKDKSDAIAPSLNLSKEKFVLEDDDNESKSIREKNSGKKGKGGIFRKIFEFLTEEDEEDDNHELILSEENESILHELDGAEKTKKRGGKKDKSKQSGDNDDVDESTKSKKKKKKTEKAKKSRLREVEEPEKKLSKRRVCLIFFICLSFGAALLVLIRICNDFSDKQEAKAAYEEGDYKTCYQNLKGKYMTESEKIMYGKSESILRIRLWIREYELFVEEGNEEHALDCLIQAVHDYPGLYDYSAQWNAVTDVSAAYSDILRILSEKYHLSEEQAKEIAAESSDIEYSRMVYTILDGGEFGSWDKEWKPEVPDIPLDDLLPEESGLGNTTFYK